jgi:hypothetical protein
VAFRYANGAAVNRRIRPQTLTAWSTARLTHEEEQPIDSPVTEYRHHKCSYHGEEEKTSVPSQKHETS